MQSVPITPNVVSSNPAHGKMCSIQHYAIKFVSDFRQVNAEVKKSAGPRSGTGDLWVRA